MVSAWIQSRFDRCVPERPRQVLRAVRERARRLRELSGIAWEVFRAARQRDHEVATIKHWTDLSRRET